MQAKPVEFFFDLGSPWTCIAFHNIQPLLANLNTDIRWRPFLVGGIHNQVNTAYVTARANDFSKPKWRQLGQSLMDWAAYSGVTMNFPSPHHPLRSVHAMRLCCVLESDQTALLTFMRAAFEAYYTDQRNLDDLAVLEDVANQAGLSGADLAKDAQAQACKDHLRANTDEALRRGAFGSPAIFVPFGADERLYFGNDQLPLVGWAVKQNQANAS